MSFIVSAALLLWQRVSYHSMVHFLSGARPIYIYAVEPTSSASADLKLLRCDSDSYVYLLQYSVLQTGKHLTSEERSCAELLSSDLSLDTLRSSHQGYTTKTGVSILFTKIVRFRNSGSKSESPCIDFVSAGDTMKNNFCISRSIDSTNTNSNNSTSSNSNPFDEICLSSWFIGVDSGDYNSLVISDIDYSSFRVYQQNDSYRNDDSSYKSSYDFDDDLTNLPFRGQMMHLSDTDLISIDARLMHYDSFSDITPLKDSVEVAVEVEVEVEVEAEIDINVDGHYTSGIQALTADTDFMCWNIRQSLLSSDKDLSSHNFSIPFVTMSGVRMSRHVVEYWLDYCGLRLSVPTVCMWDLSDSYALPSPFIYDNRDTGKIEQTSLIADQSVHTESVYSGESVCSVQSVVGISSAVINSLPSRPICLEDIIPSLHGTNGDITFVSSIGSWYSLPPTATPATPTACTFNNEACRGSENVQRLSFLRTRKAEYLELLAVLKAADNLHKRDTAVILRSLWGRYTRDLQSPLRSEVRPSPTCTPTTINMIGEERIKHPSRHTDNRNEYLDIRASDRVHQNTSDAQQSMSKSGQTRTRRMTVSQGDVHVLIFLLPHEVPIGEEIVRERREGTTSPISGLFVR